MCHNLQRTVVEGITKIGPPAVGTEDTISRRHQQKDDDVSGKQGAVQK